MIGTGKTRIMPFCERRMDEMMLFLKKKRKKVYEKLPAEKSFITCELKEQSIKTTGLPVTTAEVAVMHAHGRNHSRNGRDPLENLRGRLLPDMGDFLRKNQRSPIPLKIVCVVLDCCGCGYSPWS